MNDFNEVQIDRMALESKIKVLARRFVEIESDILRRSVITEVKREIQKYPSQIPATQYHLDRYEWIKGIYKKHLCSTCKRAKQERIKTSILWCEDEIEFLKDSFYMKYNDHWTNEDAENRIEQLQVQLTWLKEREKEQ